MCSLILVGKMCVFVSRPMKFVTSHRKLWIPKLVVDFLRERDTLRKNMKIVENCYACEAKFLHFSSSYFFIFFFFLLLIFHFSFLFSFFSFSVFLFFFLFLLLFLFSSAQNLFFGLNCFTISWNISCKKNMFGGLFHVFSCFFLILFLFLFLIFFFFQNMSRCWLAFVLGFNKICSTVVGAPWRCGVLTTWRGIAGIG